MSAGAADVSNRDPDLIETFDIIESEIAVMGYVVTMLDEAWALMTPRMRTTRSADKIDTLRQRCNARKNALLGELYRLRQPED